MRYKVFISYRHTPESREHAQALERALKKYATPVWKPPMAVFRDERSIAAGEDLPTRIRDGLSDSEFLVYLASREAAESTWVEKELTTWCADLKRAKKLIVVHISDHIAYDKSAEEIVWEKSNALPRALQKHVHRLPLIVDLTWANTGDQRDLQNARYAGDINSIVATLRGVEPQEMNDEAVVTHRRNIWSIRAGALTVAAAVLGGSVAFHAWWKEDQTKFIRHSLTSVRLAEQQLERRDGTNALATAIGGVDTPDQTLVEAMFPRKPLKESIAAISRALNNQSFEALVRSGAPFLKAYLSSDNTVVLALGGDKVANLWDRDSAVQRALPGPPLRDADAMEISGDRRMAVVRHTDGSVTILSLDTLTSRRLYADAVDSHPLIALSGNGRKLALVHRTGRITVWDTHTVEKLREFSDVPQGATVAAISGDGSILAVGTRKGGIRIMDLVDPGRPPIEIPVVQAITRLRFAPESTLVYVTADNRVWRAESTGATSPKPLGQHSRMVTSLAISPDGTQAASSSADGTVWIWDLKTISGRDHLRISKDRWANAVDFSPDGSRLAIAGDRGVVSVWDVRSTGQRATMLAQLAGHSGDVLDAHFGVNSAMLVTSATDGTVRIWRVRSGESAEISPAHTGDALLTSSANGRYLVTAGVTPADTNALLWSPYAQSAPVALPHNVELMTGAVSSDGKHVYTGSRSGTIVHWKLENAHESKPSPDLLATGLRQIRSMALSPGEDMLAAIGTGGQVTLCYVPIRGRCEATPISHGTWGNAVAFSPNSRWLGSASNGLIILWDLEDRKSRVELRGHGSSITRLLFSAASDRLVSMSEDNVTIVWDVTTGVQLAVLRGHTARVSDAAFSPNGRLLVTGSYDQTVRLWSLENMSGPHPARLDPIHTFSGHTDKVTSIAVNASGTLAASASLDGTVRVWNIAELNHRVTLEGDQSPISTFSRLVFGNDSKNLYAVSRKGALLAWGLAPALELSDEELIGFGLASMPLARSAAHSRVAAFLSSQTYGQTSPSLAAMKNCGLRTPRPFGLPPHRINGALRAQQSSENLADCKQGSAAESSPSESGGIHEANRSLEVGDSIYLRGANHLSAEDSYAKAEAGGAKFAAARRGWLALERLSERGHLQNSQEGFRRSAILGEGDGHAGLAWLAEHDPRSRDENLKRALAKYLVAEQLYEREGEHVLAARVAERRAVVSKRLPPRVVAGIANASRKGRGGETLASHEVAASIGHGPVGSMSNMADPSNPASVPQRPTPLDFEALLRESPFALRALLGLHLDEIRFPTVTGKLEVGNQPPEEFSENDAIRLGIIQPSTLASSARNWAFMPNDVCVSGDSHIAMFFNQGQLFAIYMRFIDSNFSASGGAICNSHEQIFRALRAAFLFEFPSASAEVVPYERQVFVEGDMVIAATIEGVASGVTLFLRGAPGAAP